MAIQLNRFNHEAARTIPLREKQPLHFASAPVSPTDETRFSAVPRIRTQGNVTSIVTFRGLQNPLNQMAPALQMKVRGVTRYQGPLGQASGPIGKMAASDWQDGQPLNFKLNTFRSRDGREFKKIELSAPGFGPIGGVPPEIADLIYDTLEAHPDQFQFELSNMIAGTTKGASTIGLRVNLVYTGSNATTADDVRGAFNLVLNDPNCRSSAMLHQRPTSPEAVLRLILQHEKDTKGTAAATQMAAAIDNITAKLKDPANKRILLLGHCKPDGDTLGCIVGLKNAIQLMDPGRQVDCAVDDRIPGLFREKVPGIDQIKYPDNPGKLAEVDAMIADMQARIKKPKSPADRPELLQGRIAALRQEKKLLSDRNNLLDPEANYDLVVTMDIPTASRFTDKFKPYLETAKDVVYIDHHPHRFNEWEAAKQETGLDMSLAHKKNLVWVADAVGACTQMMAVLGNRLLPQLSQIAAGKPVTQVFSKPEQQQQLLTFVANATVGTNTDTGGFTRTANLTPEDMENPVQSRPNFQPEGMSKWLMNLTTGLKPEQQIDKKWLRENVTYGISDEAHDLMKEFALKGMRSWGNIGFGVIQVDYEQMRGVWEEAMEKDGAVTLLDIQNEFKYGEVMNFLKTDPMRGKSTDPEILALQEAEKQNASPYTQDKIAVLICQDKKKGELDEKLTVAQDNGLRLSLRSAEGTDYAELLASLFSGGGHGAAAGARVDLPGIQLDTPLGIQIQGQPNMDRTRILQVLRQNLELMRNPNLTEEQKKASKIPIQVVQDPSGRPCGELLAGLVWEIRRSSPPPASASGNERTPPTSAGRSGTQSGRSSGSGRTDQASGNPTQDRNNGFRSRRRR